MVAPSYTEDLTDITLAESTTDWSALGGGGGGLGVGADFSMQGTYCVDKQITNAHKGQVYNYGTTITPGANTHFFVWLFLATPGLADTLQVGGLTVAMGTAETAYNEFHVEGKDTYGAAGRVGKCYPIRYVTTGNASPPYRTLTGAPGANPQYFGGLATTTGTVKGANLGVDAIRYGTGAYITAGEVADPGTFAGFQAQNDAVANRWGILSLVGGIYELQGRFVVGQDNAQTPTAAYFVDTDKTITIVDTVHSLSDFTQIIVDHASTTFNLTNIAILALGTTNRGNLVFNNASTTSALTNCTFTDMGTFTFRAGVTADSCTFRGCDKLNQNGATLDSCIIDGATTADGEAFIISDNPAVISNCNFTFSDGHAMEITTPGTYSFDGNTFTGYGATGTNDAAIYNNSGGLVTLNVTNAMNPTYRNGVGASTVVSQSVTLTVTVKNEGGAVIEGAQVYIQKPSPSALTSDLNNNAGDGDFVVNETIDADTPSTGWLIVWNKALNEVTPYRYASWTSLTFTLRTEVTGSCTSTGSSTQLLDTAADFGGTTDLKEGDTIRNTIDGSWAVVDEIVSASELLTSELQGGTDNTWQLNDGWSVNKLALNYTDNDDIVDVPIMNLQTNASGIASKTYTGGATSIVVRIRNNQGATKYIPYDTSGSITSSGYTLTAVIIEDEVAT